MANKLARIVGLSCPAATNTGQQLFSHNRAEKTPSAWKRYALPLARSTTTTNVSHRSLRAVARTKEQSQRRLRSLVLKMVFNDRPTLKDGPAQLILARRTSLQPKDVYICADLGKGTDLRPLPMIWMAEELNPVDVVPAEVWRMNGPPITSLRYQKILRVLLP